MHHAFIIAQLHRHARAPQAFGIGDAFVTQGIMTGDYNQGGGQAG